MAVRLLLNDSVTVTANAAGAATATIGPDSAKGPARWNVTRIAVRNDAAARRGQPPIPTCNVYVDSEAPDNLVDGTYDGSFDFADCDLDLNRGQVLLAIWAGAQAADRLTLSVTGWKEN
jgi:hypothetical protein